MKAAKKAGIIVLAVLLVAAIVLGVWGGIIPSVKLSKLEKLSMEDSETAQYVNICQTPTRSTAMPRISLTWGPAFPGRKRERRHRRM